MSGIDTSKKWPFTQKLAKAIDWRVEMSGNSSGMRLPCHVVAVDQDIVTVAFDVQNAPTLPQIKIPLAGPEYIRYPIQIGDKGYTQVSDVYLGGVSGLGSAEIANLSNIGNLSAVAVFVPISSAKWTPSENQNAIVIYGPDGAVIRDAGGTATITLKPGKITLKVSGTKIELDSGGITSSGDWTHTGKITASGDIKAGTISVETHVHIDTQPGTGLSGVPQP